MQKFKVAHIRQQGVDLIIIPLDASFGNKSNADQQEIMESLQIGATSAGLAGTVVPIWRVGQSHRFIAHVNWHPFFKSITWNQIMSNINKELTLS